MYAWPKFHDSNLYTSWENDLREKTWQTGKAIHVSLLLPMQIHKTAVEELILNDQYKTEYQG